MRTCFAGLYNLDADAEHTPGEVVSACPLGYSTRLLLTWLQADIIAKALKEPEKYVLKPQREGGSHNFYGPDVKAKLQSLSPEELSQFILMEVRAQGITQQTPSSHVTPCRGSSPPSRLRCSCARASARRRTAWLSWASSGPCWATARSCCWTRLRGTFCA